MTKTVKRKPGRPRSDIVRQKILDAAYKMVMSDGLGRLTIERVASEAGVGKATIYRSWANAHELAMAAFMANPDEELKPTGGSAKHQLKAHLRSVVERFATPRGRQITLTMASTEGENELSKAFRNQVILKSRTTGKGLIQQGIDSGTVSPGVNIEVVLDMLYGPLFYRLLAGHRPLNIAFADSVVVTMFAGIGNDN